MREIKAVRVSKRETVCVLVREIESDNDRETVSKTVRETKDERDRE